ncbi:peroxiredoxin family protein [Candidatus Leptofilum sp.]|uniref:peroxiredoxin family protein n=1 Tax=Candidatus Leptofilum sp. TaxID=3241576 RepID=UPI003B5B0ADD
MINRLKSFLIPLLLSLALFSMVWAVVQLVQDGWQWYWVGLLLAGLPIVGFFANLYRFTTVRTRANLPLLTGWVGLAAALTLIDFMWLPTLWAGLLFVGWLAYVHWYSRLNRNNNEQLVVGRPFPNILLEDESGKPIRSDDLKGQTTLYLFYRGNWCPLCMAQIKEIAAQYQELARRGVQMVLISPQPHKNTRDLAARFEVPFIFLVDVQNKAARQLGIDHPYGVPMGVPGYEADTVMPTVVIVGIDGRILYADLTDSYRIRPEPAEFLRVLDNKNPIDHQLGGIR